MVSDFFLIDTYTPDVFSTDVRNFTFCLLDSISKVRLFIQYTMNSLQKWWMGVILRMIIFTFHLIPIFTKKIKIDYKFAE